ncbi:LPS assembly protein LptD [Vibrio hangzhouensis]|uniref:LPS assembly protein LptD n=1 Tax=Vibrio hangzhouensis TaxID=462991 RepID=UPI001C961374|nr:LPS assembly protein LptD [Vibrio hangzhouensis]MBY6197110.1 LPS assembly protein LptD [Vibrio hangzhouensis]
MSRFSRTYLAASISAALLASYAHAEETSKNSEQSMPPAEQCSVDTAQSSDSNQEPINIEADSLEAIQGQRATYKGDVVVTQGNKTITADNVTLHQEENLVVAEGNVVMSDGEIKAVSDKVTNSLDQDKITLENTQYEFLCTPGRGEAVFISKTGKKLYEVEDGSITSCPEGDNSWRFLATDMKIDSSEEVAKLYNTRVEVQKVPIFYLPYLEMPIGEKRKTGILRPSASLGTKNGFEFELPVYWNLAENYDLLTTFHYMQTRGLQLKGDFRYLTSASRGEIKAEFMGKDNKYPEKGVRAAAEINHSSSFNRNWGLSINVAQVSDIDYFKDFSSSIGNRSDGQLKQEGALTYRSEHWDTALRMRDFQILQESSQPYRLYPQFEANYYMPQVYGPLDFDIISHISNFTSDDQAKPEAVRTHFEPGITLPLATTWGTWTTEARYLFTHYDQKVRQPVYYVDPTDGVRKVRELNETVFRSIPQFRTHAGLVLERPTTFIEGYRQTLEPQVQYLYVPYVDQTGIYEYDTSFLQTDYYGLFRSRKYSGVDKIAAANQISYGASSRFFDSRNKERISVSLGQIYYLDASRKSIDGSTTEPQSQYSAWAIEANINFSDRVFYRGGVQYDVDSDQLSLGNSNIEYRVGSDYIQANYRYVSKEYIQSTLNYDSNYLNSLTQNGISQIGLLGGYRISPKWIVRGQYFYDTTTSTAQEWLGQLQYESDCWYLGIDLSKQLRSWESNVIGGTPVFDQSIKFNFGITGLGGSTAPPPSGDGNALKYGRPFMLNN